MSFRITVIDTFGTRLEFAADPNRSVVRSAALAGIELTIGCVQGRCAICRARVHKGTVRPLRRVSPNAIGGPAQRDDSCVLLCSVAPTSDLVLAPLSPWHQR